MRGTLSPVSDRAPTPRVALAAALAGLLAELQGWRKDLPQDIQHAHDRGLLPLEADLRRLRDRVDAVWKAARAVPP